MIFSHRIHEGMNPDEARKEAYDAVFLRYEISRGRLLNIISKYKNSQSVNNSLLRENALALIHELKIHNNGLEAVIGKNDRLISLLNECIDEY